MPFLANRPLPFACTPWLAVLAACLSGVAGCGGVAAPHPAVGRTMPSLPIAAFADPDRAPPAFDGKVTLLNFWGTWCPPCRRELPGLVRIANRLADDDRFQFIAVSCNPGLDDFDALADETGRFLKRQGIELDAWGFADPMARVLLESGAGGAPLLEAFPTTYLIGPDAKIRRGWIGYRGRDEAEIAAAIVEALKAVPTTAAAGAAAVNAAPARRDARP